WRLVAYLVLRQHQPRRHIPPPPPARRWFFLVRCVRHVEPLPPTWRLCEFVNRWRKSSAIGGGNPPPINPRQTASPSYLSQLSRVPTLFLVGVAALAGTPTADAP